jgi:hypothetical protein
MIGAALRTRRGSRAVTKYSGYIDFRGSSEHGNAERLRALGDQYRDSQFTGPMNSAPCYCRIAGMGAEESPRFARVHFSRSSRKGGIGQKTLRHPPFLPLTSPFWALQLFLISVAWRTFGHYPRTGAGMSNCNGTSSHRGPPKTVRFRNGYLKFKLARLYRF